MKKIILVLLLLNISVYAKQMSAESCIGLTDKIMEFHTDKKKIDTINNLTVLCDDGCGKACYNIGDLLVATDPMKALEYWGTSCRFKFSEACSEAGGAFLAAAQMQKDAKQKEQFFNLSSMFYKKGAKLENPISLFRYALFLEDGIGVNIDKNKAMKMMEKSCNLNFGEACYNLALKNYRGQEIKQNYNKAINYAKKSCDLKVEPGCYLSGNMSDAGKGTRGDPVEAMRFYSKSCDLGGARGCMFIGMSYELGKYGYPKDLKKAQKLFVKGCEYAKKYGNAEITKQVCNFVNK